MTPFKKHAIAAAAGGVAAAITKKATDNATASAVACTSTFLTVEMLMVSKELEEAKHKNAELEKALANALDVFESNASVSGDIDAINKRFSDVEASVAEASENINSIVEGIKSRDSGINKRLESMNSRFESSINNINNSVDTKINGIINQNKEHYDALTKLTDEKFDKLSNMMSAELSSFVKEISDTMRGGNKNADDDSQVIKMPENNPAFKKKQKSK